MAGSRNVQIPSQLFDDVMSFFEYLNISDYNFPRIFNYHGILAELRKKQHSINMRTTYSRIVYAKNEEQRDSAYADYLYLRKKGRK